MMNIMELKSSYTSLLCFAELHKSFLCFVLPFVE